MTKDTGDDLLVELSARRFSVGFSIFFFAFGIAAGFLMAFTGLGFLEDSAGVIAGVFLIALVTIASAGTIIFLLRRQILGRIFGVAEAQVELFAAPLTGVAEGAVQRDPERAIQSARRLIQIALARYAWLATRRWIMTSLTALIAAMAALAGTALLFKQNALIGEQSSLLAEQNVLIATQSTLLEEQNERIRQQNVLLAQDVQLAEATRNAGLAVEVTAIAALLGATADRVTMEPDETATGGSARLFPVIDPFSDLERGLIMRISSASQAMRPYRFLDNGIVTQNPNDRLRIAMAGRRDYRPDLWERLAGAYDWQVPGDENLLIDRPASPERGQLLRVLVGSGLRDLELLSFFGLDLSFAHAQGITLPLVRFDHANLAYADFSYADIVESSFAGTLLDNSRFRRATIVRTDFSGIGGPQTRGPLSAPGVEQVAIMNGADFSDAVIRESRLRRVQAAAAVFDRALLLDADFTEAYLGLASFRDAIVIAARFDGALLVHADFDGAILFAEDPLSELAAAAAEHSFDPSRYRAEPLAPGYAMTLGRLADFPDHELIAALTGDLPVWRLVAINDR